MRRWFLGWVLLLALSAPVHAQYQKPDSDTVFNANQARLFKTDFDILVAGTKGNGVWSGAAVSAQGSPNMTVAVAAGTAQVSGALVIITAGNVTITTAHASQPRIDLVVVNSSGTKSVTAGTAAASPRKPAIPSNSIVLAEVYVPATDTAIESNQITDNRILVQLPGVVNVLEYGAIPDGSTDSTAALQAAIDAAVVANPRIRTVYVPSGPDCYVVTEPLLVHASHLPRIVGESAIGFGIGTCIESSGFIGPTMHLRSDDPPTPLNYTTSLVTGSGAALARTKTSDTAWLDLVDAGSATVLNGLTALSIEGFITLSSFSGDFQYHVLESAGALYPGGTTTTAYMIRVDTSGHLNGCINVGGSCDLITASGALDLDTVYQFELNFSGTTVRLYYGEPGGTSVLAGTQSVSGTVTHAKYETMAIGSTRSNYPHGAPATEAFDGAIDSIRFSNTARHTSTWTVPTTKFTSDANTLLLENFDNETDDFSIVTTPAGPTYLNVYGANGIQARGSELAWLELYSQQTPLYANGVILMNFHDLTLRSTGPYGFNSGNDTFLNSFANLRIVSESGTVGRVGMAQMSQTGICEYTALDFTGWPVSFVSRAGSGTIRDSYFHSGNALLHMLLIEGSWTVLNSSFSSEDNPTALDANLALSGNDSIVVIGTYFEHLSTTAPNIRSRADKSVVVVGSRFTQNAGSSEIVNVVSAPTQPITLLNPSKDQSSIPWSTSASVTVWPPGLAGAPTVSSGFGTTPSIASGSTTTSMRVDVGTGGSATSGVLTMPSPPAAAGWNCVVNNLTAAAAHRADNTRQTASTTTTVTIENQTTTDGSAVAWTASDIVVLSCQPY